MIRREAVVRLMRDERRDVVGHEGSRIEVEVGDETTDCERADSDEHSEDNEILFGG